MAPPNPAPPEPVVPPEAGGPGSTPFDSTATPDVPIRMITRLVVVGENIQLDLPPEQERFTLGAASAPIVDLTLHGEMVSRLHAVLTRTGAKLRVVDQRSTNGTFFQGHRDADFELSPGQVFEVSRRVKLLALDPGLAILRNRLLWVVGLRNRAAADAAIQVIAANAPLLLLGPPGCEQHATAAEIHRRSAFNDREFVIAPTTFASRAEQDQLLARGTRSTVFLDLSRPTAPMPAHFVGHLFADCRPIIAAPTRERAVDVLDSYARRLQEIELATPAERPDDIPRLLDALIVEEHARAGGGDLLPLAALGAANLDGLKAHTWPDHFIELRAQAKRLHAVLTNDLRIRASARALGLKSATALVQALDRIGVRLAAADGDDVPTSEDAEALPTPPGARTRP
jgi:hypothetical protein